MPNKYYLVESGALEHLLRTHFLLTQSLLLFEHLLSHSDRPMFLSARKSSCSFNTGYVFVDPFYFFRSLDSYSGQCNFFQ